MCLDIAGKELARKKGGFFHGVIVDIAGIELARKKGGFFHGSTVANCHLAKVHII